MKTTAAFSRRAGAIALLGAAALIAVPIFAPHAHAQGPQGGFGGGPNNGPDPFGGGGNGGRQGFGRRPPFASGTVTAIDAGAGTITISGPFGDSQVIQTQGTTKIVSQTAASVSDLKKGDTIEVRGVPTGLTASSLTIGQSPLGGPGGGGPGGFGGPPPPPPPGGGGPGAPPAPAMAYAKGTVTGTNPLTISLNSSASLTLKMDPSAKVTKYATITLNSIKVGDKIVGMGTANDDGSFAAATVAVNVDMGQMGRGGFSGGRRGGGGYRGNGFGGPNGGGPNNGPGGGDFGGPPPGGPNGGDFGGPGGPPPPGGMLGGPGGPPHQ